jgi:DNA-binding transcriptional regulator YiaG
MALHSLVYSRVDELQRFLARINSADLSSESEFRTLMQEVLQLLELSEDELADALYVSRPTVNRWVNGRSSPLPGMRRSVLAWVREQLQRRMRRAARAS